MALPSQMQSSPVRGRYVYRRRRKRRGPVLLAALVAFGVAFWFAYDWGEDDGADSGEAGQTSVMAIADPLASNMSREVMNTTSAPPRWTPATPEPVAAVEEPLPIPAPEPVTEIIEEPLVLPDPVDEVPIPGEAIEVSTVQGGPIGMGAALIEQGRFLEARALLTQATRRQTHTQFETQCVARVLNL